MKSTKKALIIDGNSLVFRAFYATLSMYEYAIKNGIRPSNGIKTSLKMINKILNSDQYDYALVAFDSKEKTDRAKIYEGYKATRKKPVEGLIEQLVALQDGFSYLGLNVLSSPGIEADDLIGSFSALANKDQITCHIYTSDQDIFQLVNKYNVVYQFVKGVSVFNQVHERNFQEHFHDLKPEDVIQYKALVGDSSDNIPGVKGIGEKTAVQLIKDYLNIDNIYANLDQIKPSIKDKLVANKANCYLSKELATIRTDCLVDQDINNFKLKPLDQQNYFAFCEYYKISHLD
ncbi:5'-3' exonuclease [Mycoplasmoides gallisepticum str. F]|uniref:5'-3' exonuclease n=1 Tax=Mycoplasmoides gallisepticum TaxID=2096 RepID=UPI0001C3996D|nr:5'-3' exonuclease [Mycoplasmoides gallisepticum]ADC31532.1 5'-3' exonuclease [Mycoplasmoides gallisepticum str. F]